MAKSTTKGQYSFARVPSVQVPRSTFDRSCGLKTTFDAGRLVPFFVDEALPGDTMQMQTSTFARMATPLHPIMDNMQMDYFFFAVPIRLIWDNWKHFMGEEATPGDSQSTEYLVPTIDPGVVGQPVGSLWDYFGLPIGTPSIPRVAAFWHRAYNLIYNEWFRDQNLVASLPVPTDDGPDAPTNYVLMNRGKRHDYFTSCLPWPQKGPAVDLPLGISAPVTGTVSGGTIAAAGTGVPTFDLSGSTYNLQSTPAGAGAQWSGTKGSVQNADWSNPNLEVAVGGTAVTGTADLTNATAATINQLREAFQIQKLYEKDARGGTRYTEVIRSHFGVTSPDARLQRPEYLGGGTQKITFNPVAQNSQTISTGLDQSPQGNLAAFATAGGTLPGWSKSFTEHCVIIGLVNVWADLTYQQNVPRMFSRETRWDFYWPSLAHIGEQAVLNREIYYAVGEPNEEVFGYQERWAEYRYKPSTLTGKMRSPAPTHATSLDTWHLAQDFAGTTPLLNGSFITENPPVQRVIAVTGEPEFLLDAYFSYKCTRPMPTYSVPGMIDRF